MKDLTARFDISQPAVSQHLATLRHAGLVRNRREGRLVYYRVDPRGLTPLVDWIAHYRAFWTERAGRSNACSRHRRMTDATRPDGPTRARCPRLRPAPLTAEGVGALTDPAGSRWLLPSPPRAQRDPSSRSPRRRSRLGRRPGAAVSSRSSRRARSPTLALRRHRHRGRSRAADRDRHAPVARAAGFAPAQKARVRRGATVDDDGGGRLAASSRGPEPRRSAGCAVARWISIASRSPSSPTSRAWSREGGRSGYLRAAPPAAPSPQRPVPVRAAVRGAAGGTRRTG